MGRVLLVVRLAARNIRRRPAEAALLLLAIMAATTTLALGLALHGVAHAPYASTRNATAGPDVVASVGPDLIGRSNRPGDLALVPADLAALEALADAPGVVDHSGPYPSTVVDLEARGATTEVWVQGRDPADAAVDQPKLTQGHWVEDGGAVVEAAFADVLGVGPGDELTLDGRTFRVAGVAVTAAALPYTKVCFGRTCSFDIPQGPGATPEGPPVTAPDAEPIDPASFPPPPDDAGLIWLTEADARGLTPEADRLFYSLNLALADPGDARSFVDAHVSPSASAPFLASWQDLRNTHDEMVGEQSIALVTGGWILAVLAVASAAVLVGGRIADQTRRVGLLKAVGGTPGLVAAVLLAEYTILALLAAASGLAVALLAAPLLTDPGAGLVGRAGAPSLTLSTVGLVTALALGVAALASFGPAVRAAFTSTVHALTDRARPPRRSSRLIALSARLPVPLLFGLRMAARRPRRVLLGGASILVAVSGIVAVLAAHATLGADWDGPAGLDPQADRLNRVLLVLTVMLVVLAAINVVFITWATALDTRHSSALARALGATPTQVSAGLSAAQVLPVLAGATLGIPAGLALWSALSNDEALNPPAWQLLAIAPTTTLIVAALTTIPARLATHRPLAPTLQSEAV